VEGVHRNRTFTSIFKKRIYEDGLCIINAEPVVPPPESSLKAHSALGTTQMRFQQVGEKETVMELVKKLEMGQLMSKKATNGFLRKHLSIVTETAFFFVNNLDIEELLPEDGKVFADHLMLRVKGRQEVRMAVEGRSSRRGFAYLTFATPNPLTQPHRGGQARRRRPKHSSRRTRQPASSSPSTNSSSPCCALFWRTSYAASPRLRGMRSPLGRRRERPSEGAWQSA
jgi:hypothetical protein